VGSVIAGKPDFTSGQGRVSYPPGEELSIYVSDRRITDAENFFSHLKSEFFHHNRFDTVEAFTTALDLHKAQGPEPGPRPGPGPCGLSEN
jgi:integrase-like protein